MPSQHVPGEALEALRQHLSQGRADLALNRGSELLQIYPDDVNLIGTISSAHIQLGDMVNAQKLLERGVSLAPTYYRFHEDLGLVLLAQGHSGPAVSSLRKALELNSGEPRVAMGLARALLADKEYQQVIVLCTSLQRASPNLIEASYLIGCAFRHTGRLLEARGALEAVQARMPHHTPTLRELASTLEYLDELSEALTLRTRVAELNDKDAGDALACADLNSALGRSEEALAWYERARSLNDDLISAHLGVGHMLKTLGRSEEAVTVYRDTASRFPDSGAPFISLSNMKNYVFTDLELEQMQAGLQSSEAKESSKIGWFFALGKAFDDRGDFVSAWSYYSRGNALQSVREPYAATATEEYLSRIMDSYSSYRGTGVGTIGSVTPVFIVGMPRSGSTLVEQILASHSRVEATRELPTIERLASNLRVASMPGATYPEAVAGLEVPDLQRLAAEYLRLSEPHRREGSEFFIDKMPNNFVHVGLINLMFPDSPIIDVRRDPLDVCVANLRHHFARGQAFAYSEEGVAHYHRHYVSMMDYWDEVLPGRVTRVRYENLVAGGDQQIDNLLNAIGLASEPGCHKFYESPRAVHTASSEQVRQPMHRSAIGTGKRYGEAVSKLHQLLQMID